MKVKQNIIQRSWPCIPDHPYRILTVGGSGSGKTNFLLNLVNNQLDITKIYLDSKDPYEAKYQHLINRREKVGVYHFYDSKAFIEYSKDMKDVFKNIEDYNPGKKRKVLIVFDDMIDDIINNKKLNPVVTELLIRSRKLNISIVFILFYCLVLLFYCCIVLFYYFACIYIVLLSLAQLVSILSINL